MTYEWLNVFINTVISNNIYYYIWNVGEGEDYRFTVLREFIKKLNFFVYIHIYSIDYSFTD